MEQSNKPPVEEEEEGYKPKTLWDMYMEYVKAKNQAEQKRFVDAVD